MKTIKKDDVSRRKIKMNYIISFPRSGQHLVESILGYIYKKLNKDFTYCEFYSCCNKIGECPKKSNFQKNHDFWINKDYNKFLIKNSDKYLVLYRKDKIKQLEAYYRFYVKTSRKKLVYNYDELISFAKNNSLYYDNFINKWVNNNLNNILKIEYYDFVNDPNFYIKNIYYHFNPTSLTDESIFNIKNIDFNIDNGFRKREIHNTIKVMNNIDVELYEKIKKDLEW